MIRPEIKELAELGSFPSSQRVDAATIKRQQETLSRITPPVSDAEVRELVKLFGPDDYFGLAWTVLHLVEGSPKWPLADCLEDRSNEWIRRLKARVERADQ
jgi:hypothetical protein